MKTLTNRSWTRSSTFHRCGVALVALVGVFFASTADGKMRVKVSAPSSAIDAFENWTSGIAWDQITNFKNANASRPVVDLVLELQALKAGGLDFEVQLERSLTYDLAKKQLLEGHADLMAETVWDTEIDPAAMLKTDTVIRQGEFVKGVYVLPTSQDLLKVTTAEELRGFTGAVVATWGLDVKTMEDMKLKGLVKSPAPEIVFTNIKKHTADFALWEFSANPEMSIEIAGVKLVPVPNCKVAILGSRSWIVMKSSPSSNLIYDALQAGTKILRSNGTIERAYRESGFFNPRVADWKRL